MIKNFFIILILITFTSCDKFDSRKWKFGESIYSGKRKSMMNDLMTFHLKEGMTYSEILALLGDPDTIMKEKKVLSYLVYEEMDFTMEPESYLYLNIGINKDSLLISKDLEEITIKK